MRNFLTMKLAINGCRRVLVALLLASVAIPLSGVAAYAQGSYFDPSLGVGDSIIRSDVFVGDKQGRVTATEGLFTKQLSGWLSGDAEVLQGVVVNVGPGCSRDSYLNNPAGKIALIVRGTCSFVQKITLAYNAGAIGAIVYNDAARGDALVTMAPASPGMVPIPGFFVGNSSGLALSASPVTVKIQAASFRALKDGVTALVASGILTKPQAGSLKDTISSAENAASAGDFATALNLISQFQQEILSLSEGGVLPFLDWQGLDNAAGVIAARLQPPFTSDTQ
jgi:hypothetical protein